MRHQGHLDNIDICVYSTQPEMQAAHLINITTASVTKEEISQFPFHSADLNVSFQIVSENMIDFYDPDG